MDTKDKEHDAENKGTEREAREHPEGSAEPENNLDEVAGSEGAVTITSPGDEDMVAAEDEEEVDAEAEAKDDHEGQEPKAKQHPA